MSRYVINILASRDLVVAIFSEISSSRAISSSKGKLKMICLISATVILIVITAIDSLANQSGLASLELMILL